MKLEDLVTSLDMSKKLKEVGFEADTLLWWTGRDIARVYIPFNTDSILEKSIPAYTFQQLWEVLPRKIEAGLSLELTKIDAATSGSYDLLSYDSLFESGTTWQSSLRLPDAAAQAVLWCIENGYIELERRGKVTNYLTKEGK